MDVVYIVMVYIGMTHISMASRHCTDMRAGKGADVCTDMSVESVPQVCICMCIVMSLFSSAR